MIRWWMVIGWILTDCAVRYELSGIPLLLMELPKV